MRRMFLLFAVLIIVASPALADILPPPQPGEGVQADMLAYDLARGAVITNAALLAKFQSGSTYSVSDENGSFSLLLPLGTSSVDLGADLDSTPGYDYIAVGVAPTATPGQRVGFMPAGTISGRALDFSNSPLSNATISLSCSSYSTSTRTDSAGRFEFEFAPAGDCLLSSPSAQKSVLVSQGQIAAPELAPLPSAPTPTPEGNNLWLAIAAAGGAAILLIALIIGMIALFLIVRHFLLRGEQPEYEAAEEAPAPAIVPTPTAPAPHSTSGLTPTSGQLDVMQTLPEREYEVVKLLLMSNGRMRASKIRHTLALPKTSFFRIVTALENKTIVKVEKTDTFPEICLQKWFLSK